METLSFNISIAASPEQVWQVLWDDLTYRHWTSVYSPQSCYVGELVVGGKVQFLDGTNCGLSSIVEEFEANRVISFRHKMRVENGVEEPLQKNWTNALERYVLTPVGEGTELVMSLDSVDEFKEYFLATSPMALDLVRKLAEGSQRPMVFVSATITAPVEKVWNLWSLPEHITQWCWAIDTWHAPAATNDLREGGSFSTTMAAKDGSFSFEFGGVYDQVEEHRLIAYTMSDGRTVRIDFEVIEGKTQVIEAFEPESQNPAAMQRDGWQAILNNFKAYVESQS